MALDPELKNSVAYLQDHAHGMRAVLAIADAISDISVLETAANEAEARRDKAVNDLENQVGRVQATLTALEVKAEEASGKAENILTAAREEADKIRANANTQAEADAARIHAAAADKLRLTNADLEQARADLADRARSIAKAEETAEALRIETADLERRANEAREYLTKLAAGN
jgi:chromosome segregation ATPase